MKYIAEAGENIYVAISKAKEIAKSGYEEVTMVFNEHHIRVYRDSYEYDIYEIYRLRCELERLKHL